MFFYSTKNALISSKMKSDRVNFKDWSSWNFRTLEECFSKAGRWNFFNFLPSFIQAPMSNFNYPKKPSFLHGMNFHLDFYKNKLPIESNNHSKNKNRLPPNKNSDFDVMTNKKLMVCKKENLLGLIMNFHSPFYLLTYNAQGRKQKSKWIRGAQKENGFPCPLLLHFL